MRHPICALVSFSALTFTLAGCGAGDVARPGRTAATTTVTVTEAPTAPGAGGGYSEGTYLVPADIAPGTYRTAGPTNPNSAVGCRFWRLRGTSGIQAEQIAYDSSRGPAVVTIQASDAAFKTDACQPWTPVK